MTLKVSPPQPGAPTFDPRELLTFRTATLMLKATEVCQHYYGNLDNERTCALTFSIYPANTTLLLLSRAYECCYCCLHKTERAQRGIHIRAKSTGACTQAALAQPSGALIEIEPSMRSANMCKSILTIYKRFSSEMAQTIFFYNLIFL